VPASAADDRDWSAITIAGILAPRRATLVRRELVHDVWREIDQVRERVEEGVRIGGEALRQRARLLRPQIPQPFGENVDDIVTVATEALRYGPEFLRINPVLGAESSLQLLGTCYTGREFLLEHQGGVLHGIRSPAPGFPYPVSPRSASGIWSGIGHHCLLYSKLAALAKLRGSHPSALRSVARHYLSFMVPSIVADR
jgi:hypothetical protein